MYVTVTRVSGQRVTIPATATADPPDDTRDVRSAEHGSKLMDGLDWTGVAYPFPAGGTLRRVTDLELAIMRLVTSGGCEIRHRTAGGGDPR